MSNRPFRHSSGSKIKVLVIDDDPIFCESVKDTLSTKGYLVAGANTTDQAEKLIRTNQISTTARYDLILLDIQLGGQDGLDFLARMRAKKWLDCPVVLVTGEPRPVHVERAKALGVDSFLLKPFNAVALQLRVTVTLTPRNSAPPRGRKAA